VDSKIPYKDAPSENIRLPREVYYRCLWTVRDEKRLRRLAALLDPGSEPSVQCDPEDARLVREETARHAAFEAACIDRALSRIPDVYREGLLDNIRDKTPLGDFAHPNTWKRWKLVFLYELAQELCLI
jgi:hypothetical protein